MWSAAGLATNAAGAVTVWRGIGSTAGTLSELHYSELAAVSGWCRSVRHEAQCCSSRFRGSNAGMEMYAQLIIVLFLGRGIRTDVTQFYTFQQQPRETWAGFDRVALVRYFVSLRFIPLKPQVEAFRTTTKTLECAFCGDESPHRYRYYTHSLNKKRQIWRAVVSISMNKYC